METDSGLQLKNLQDIAQRLRRLQESSPVAAADLPAWNARARKFVDWQLTAHPEVRLPPQVMFYLHDADIRVREPAYREDQDEALAAVIQQLERGIVPEGPGSTIQVHPRWLGAIALVVLAAIAAGVLQT